MKSVRQFFAIIITFALCGCGGEEVEVEIGYRGKARRDPFLAAERFLEENDFDVTMHTWFGAGPSQDAAVVATAQSFDSYGTSDSVLDWVSHGGNLLLLLDGGETFHDDFEEEPLKKKTKTRTERTELLEKLGISEAHDSNKELEVKFDDAQAKVEMPGRFKWKDGHAPARTIFSAGDGDLIGLTSFRSGAGRITIAAHAKPFRNRYIGEADNAWLLLRLIGQANANEVWFLNGVKVSFFGMLWEHGWMALIAAAVLLAVWLWRSLPRFGPLRAPEETGMRDFAEHLSLTGAFLWRHRQHAHLIAPLREAVTRAALRCGLIRNDPDFPEKLAELAQMEPMRVRAALLSENITEPRHFLRAIQDLRQLHEKVCA